MNETQRETSYPIYIKVTAILVGLLAGIYILYVLGDILVPLAFSILIAILLNPLYARLEKLMPKVPAILLTLFIAIIFVAGLFYFLSTQISVFIDSLPQIKQKLTLLLEQLEVWAKNKFGVDVQKQVAALTSGTDSMLTSTVAPVLSFISVVLLIPTYVFLFLYYKPLLVDFLFQIFSEKHSLRVAEILAETKTAVQSFMQGLMIEMIIVSAMNAVALVLIGVPSAIVIGVIGGILNMVPYIGGLIAIAIPVLMVTITRDGFSGQLAVVVSYLVIQFIDNNILVPKIVSSKVQINALVSIVAVLLGGALWGVTGMFLSIPMIGVLKIIFDRIDEMKPWGMLLGIEIPSEHIGLVWQKRWARIFRRRQKKKELEEAAAVAEDDTPPTATAEAP
ncbi:AI-2E family transporter [Flavisolibacter ginsenosidimutans]|uniref:AI-2E family transporter n=1 Tax=Flavisolibacter ginsenosidimutans TaxID=661481 RepID=A0A5B8UM25_9BACT|nr:AI-2E family transporter [Flavisolibacter ginsenosidimutans]QEC57731.1 AI-2E family transporter [Flavisolibacter ginsenosidimutans]